MGHSGARRIGASRNAAIGMVPFPATIRGERARDTGRSVLQGEASSVSAKGYTFGVEEEYQIIDPETRGLSPHSEGVLRRARRALGEERVVPELRTSQIEAMTPV